MVFEVEKTDTETYLGAKIQKVRCHNSKGKIVINWILRDYEDNIVLQEKSKQDLLDSIIYYAIEGLK